MQLINITVPQLRAATKAGIITAISNRLQSMTKREIIIWLLEIDRIQDAPVITRRNDGQVERVQETETDAETGAVVSTRVTAWTYYPSGEVDTITITADGRTRRIKHFTDGRQPEVSNDNGI